MATPAEESGNWLINRIVDEAERLGEPLALDQEPSMLGASVFDVAETVGNENMRTLVVHLNATCVPLIRSAIEHAKASGVPTLKVRKGLRLPTEWQHHYERIYNDPSFDWVISGVVQSAFFGDPTAGETKPWKSK